MNPEQLLLENLALIDRVIASICRKYHVTGADAEDLRSTVRLRLIENDYAVLRKFEGRSSISTYLNVVIQRIALDLRIARWGKWRPNASARRLGEAGVQLDMLLNRDGRSLDEALSMLLARGHACSKADVERMAASIGFHSSRPLEVSIDGAAEILPGTADAEEEVMQHERDTVARRVSGVLRSAFRHLSGEDRLILRMRFEEEHSVAEIARMLHLDQKPLYKRLQSLQAELRRALEKNGIHSKEISHLLDGGSEVLDFRPRESVPARPSNSEEHGVPSPEGSHLR